jgi:hypothetical protein
MVDEGVSWLVAGRGGGVVMVDEGVSWLEGWRSCDG